MSSKLHVGDDILQDAPAHCGSSKALSSARKTSPLPPELKGLIFLSSSIQACMLMQKHAAPCSFVLY